MCELAEPQTDLFLHSLRRPTTDQIGQHEATGTRGDQRSLNPKRLRLDQSLDQFESRMITTGTGCGSGSETGRISFASYAT
jgi:hypothetical protein